MSDARVAVSVASVPLCRPQNSDRFWNFHSWQPMKSGTEGLFESWILCSRHKRTSVPEFIGDREWKFYKSYRSSVAYTIYSDGATTGTPIRDWRCQSWQSWQASRTDGAKTAGVLCPVYVANIFLHWVGRNNVGLRSECFCQNSRPIYF